MYSANGAWSCYIHTDVGIVDCYNNKLDADEVAAYRALLVAEGFVTANDGGSYVKGNLILELNEYYGGLDIYASLFPTAA